MPESRSDRQYVQKHNSLSIQTFSEMGREFYKLFKRGNWELLFCEIVLERVKVICIIQTEIFKA